MSIKINLKIFLFIILFYLTKQIQIYMLIMTFAFIHEMGHLLCGVCLGLKVKSIKIMPLGLSVEFKVPVSSYNEKIICGNELELKKIIIALAGPITNILIIIIGCIINANPIIIYTNMLIALFNLIPIYPLDGGRIIKSIVHIIKGRKTAIEYINIISNSVTILITAISSIGIYYYKNIAILLIVIYLWGMLIVENKKYSMKMKMYDIIERDRKNYNSSNIKVIEKCRTNS